MIKINLSKKEQMILEIMYLDFFRDKKSILSYIEGMELENLRKEQ